MFGPRIKLFRIGGFEIGIDPSWFLIVILVTWSLAAGLFPYQYPFLSPATYWWMGVTGALGLFLSIVLHELSHARTAEAYGMKMRGITLFIFGGVAEMQDEPPTPKTEFLVAIAGPLASVGLGILFVFLGWLAAIAGAATPVLGVLAYLGWVNFALVVFNLVPAFPLDGGRMLRSALWHWGRSLRWATRITSNIGSVFGFILIGLGVLSFLWGNMIGGLWWFLIGMFLRGAARMSYQQLVVREMLQGEPVLRFMHPQPDTVPETASIADLVENHVYRYHHKMFPVMADGHVIGCVTTHQVRDVPREEWGTVTVGQVMQPCSPENTASPDDDAMKTLTRMHRNGRSRLLVVDRGELKGIISLKDLTRFIALKLDVEPEAA